MQNIFFYTLILFIIFQQVKLEKNVYFAHLQKYAM